MVRTHTTQNLSHALDGTTTTRIICKTARLIDVCNIFISSFLYFRDAKVRAFFIISKQIEEKNHSKTKNCKIRAALFLYFIT